MRDTDRDRWITTLAVLSAIAATIMFVTVMLSF